jgi:glucokinase
MSGLIGAIDIGGTKIAATIADASGLLARITTETVKSGSPEAVANQTINLLNDAARSVDVSIENIQSVGVSSCGPFKKLDGKVSLVAPNICGGLAKRGDLPNDWTELPLQTVLERRFAHVVVQNDCIAALVGERMFGAAIDQPDCVYVTWSTGIGFGLCVDGNLLSGKQGNAGHAGHLLMDPNSQILCGCGNVGDLESLISGFNISRGLTLDTPELFMAARDGNVEAMEVVRKATVWFGKALYDLVVTLDTRLFVIGGSVWQHHGDWLAPIVQHEIDSRFPILTAGVSLVSPGLKAFVADVGALSLVMPEQWVNDWRHRRPWEKIHHLTN